MVLPLPAQMRFFEVYRFAVNPFGFACCHSAHSRTVSLQLAPRSSLAPRSTPRMHAAVGSSRLLVRVSMCLLHSFSQIFGEQAKQVLGSRPSKKKRKQENST